MAVVVVVFIEGFCEVTIRSSFFGGDSISVILSDTYHDDIHSIMTELTSSFLKNCTSSFGGGKEAMRHQIAKW
jgi:hypothetical protein